MVDTSHWRNSTFWMFPSLSVPPWQESWGLHGGINHMFAAMEAPGKQKIEFFSVVFLFLGPICGGIHHTYAALEAPGKPYIFRPVQWSEMTRWRSTGTCDHLTGLSVWRIFSFCFYQQLLFSPKLSTQDWGPPVPLLHHWDFWIGEYLLCCIRSACSIILHSQPVVHMHASPF